MAVSTTQLKKLQEQVRKLRSENTRLKRQLRKFSSRGKKSARQTVSRTGRKQRFEVIRQAARRNAMTEEEAASLALEAQSAPSD